VRAVFWYVGAILLLIYNVPPLQGSTTVTYFATTLFKAAAMPFEVKMCL